MTRVSNMFFLCYPEAGLVLAYYNNFVEQLAPHTFSLPGPWLCSIFTRQYTVSFDCGLQLFNFKHRLVERYIRVFHRIHFTSRDLLRDRPIDRCT